MDVKGLVAPPGLALLPQQHLPERTALEFLEDMVECASLQRTKHTSGSPRHKGPKKTHFINNMRQYDTRNSRIMLICAKQSLCAAFSVLPCGEGLRVSDLSVDSQRQRHLSGDVSMCSEMVFQFESVELGAGGKVVSYQDPVPHQHPGHAQASPLPQPRPRVPPALLGSRCKPVLPRVAPAGSELGTNAGDDLEYNPNLLADPQ